jgi:acetyltransferase
MAALEAFLVRFSQLVSEHLWIKESDIDPLYVAHDRVVVLDARIVLHEPLIIHFHQNLSDRSVYMRNFHYLRPEQRVSHEPLTRISFIDYDRQMALVAERRDPATGCGEILGRGPAYQDPWAPRGGIRRNCDRSVSRAWNRRPVVAPRHRVHA